MCRVVYELCDYTTGGGGGAAAAADDDDDDVFQKNCYNFVI